MKDVRIALLLLAAMMTAPAHAELLATFEVSETNSGENIANLDSIHPVLGVDASADFGQPGVDIFGTVRIFSTLLASTSDIGTTFVSNSTNDPNFDAWAGYATNGILNEVLFGFWRNVPSPETGFGALVLDEPDLYGLPGGQIDFAAFVIDRVELTFTTLEFRSPGTNPQGNGIWTDYDATAQVQIFGTAIPEPASFLLTSLTIPLLLKRRT